MRVACVIPARGGSKGLPDKNLQPLGGVPLVAWAVRAARMAESVDDVLVSTDDSTIGAVSQQHGAEVIHRPDDLAGDAVPTAPVIEHAVRWLEESGRLPDAVVTLQCTSPFTSGEDIDRALAKLAPDCGSVLAVTPTSDLHCRRSGDLLEAIDWDLAVANAPRQLRADKLHFFGAFYVTWAAQIDGQHPLHVPPVRFVEIPPERAIDIDSPLDLHVAEALLRYRETWIVVGSSPGAQAQLTRVLSRCPQARTITTNAGLDLFDRDRTRLNVYFLSDSTACPRHGPAARYRFWPATRMVTLARLESALKARGVEWFDEFLEADRPTLEGPKFVRGQYTQSCGLSGLYCLQYAVNQGARQIHLVGMEGYRGKGDYFNREENTRRHANHTRDYIEPFCRSVIETCPDIEFVFHGRLAYRVSGPNVRSEQ